ncbi:MAG TPA: DUF3313 domain-containing protein [Reyranella sp.]|jgi:hypothetical protein|nr:DUF3313 domain-containing protein [Reyranella sp.]
MRSLIVIPALLLLAACNTRPATTAGLGKEVPLQARAGDVGGDTLVYRAPNVDARKYRGIYVAPADIYTGNDADWGGTDMATRQRVAAFLTGEFRRVLRAHGRMVLDAPTASSVTLQLTLAGITSTRGVAATALKLTPVGLGITLAKSAADLPASFTGSITVSGKLLDSGTHAILAGFVSRESPTAIDPRTIGGTEETARLAATKGAESFADGLDKATR